MTKLTRAGMRAMMAALAKHPPGAWVSRRGWERMVRAGVKPAARQSGTAPAGVMLPGVQTFSPEVVDFEDIGRVGVWSLEGRRVWVLGVRVVYDAGGVGRLVVLEGDTVWREAQVETTGVEVMGVVAFLDPEGFWASDAPPRWVRVLEADPDADYPVSVVAADVLVAFLNAVAVVRGAPTFYARL